MINQKLIAEVKALRAKQLRALNMGANAECFVAETYGLLKWRD